MPLYGAFFVYHASMWCQILLSDTDYILKSNISAAICQLVTAGSTFTLCPFLLYATRFATCSPPYAISQQNLTFIQ